MYKHTNINNIFGATQTTPSNPTPVKHQRILKLTFVMTSFVALTSLDLSSTRSGHK